MNFRDLRDIAAPTVFVVLRSPGKGFAVHHLPTDVIVTIPEHEYLRRKIGHTIAGHIMREESIIQALVTETLRRYNSGELPRIR